ncbi:220_t:CDS:2, partial [Paraglomus occultum]
MTTNVDIQPYTHPSNQTRTRQLPNDFANDHIDKRRRPSGDDLLQRQLILPSSQHQQQPLQSPPLRLPLNGSGQAVTTSYYTQQNGNSYQQGITGGQLRGNHTVLDQQLSQSNTTEQLKTYLEKIRLSELFKQERQKLLASAGQKMQKAHELEQLQARLMTGSQPQNVLQSYQALANQPFAQNTLVSPTRPTQQHNATQSGQQQVLTSPISPQATQAVSRVPISSQPAQQIASQQEIIQPHQHQL